jgi:hypothetical protein
MALDRNGLGNGRKFAAGLLDAYYQGAFSHSGVGRGLPPMNLLARLISLWSTKSLAQVAGEIARRCYAPVRVSAEPGARRLSTAEARGYIRAKATPVIRVAVASHLRHQSRQGDWSRAILIEKVTEQVVLAVLADVVARREEPARRQLAA